MDQSPLSIGSRSGKGHAIVIADSDSNNKALAGERLTMWQTHHKPFAIYVASSSAREAEEHWETIKGNIGKPNQISDDRDQNRWN